MLTSLTFNFSRVVDYRIKRIRGPPSPIDELSRRAAFIFWVISVFPYRTPRLRILEPRNGRAAVLCSVWLRRRYTNAITLFPNVNEP